MRNKRGYLIKPLALVESIETNAKAGELCKLPSHANRSSIAFMTTVSEKDQPCLHRYGTAALHSLIIATVYAVPIDAVFVFATRPQCLGVLTECCLCCHQDDIEEYAALLEIRQSGVLLPHHRIPSSRNSMSNVNSASACRLLFQLLTLAVGDCRLIISGGVGGLGVF